MNLVIVDTQCANLASIEYTLKRLGYKATISQEKEAIEQADKLILPGVGTARAAIQQLKKVGLIETLVSYSRPVLGICLGMQILAKHSGEGNVQTLGICQTDVKQLQCNELPLPHMGWNTLTLEKEHPLFADISPESYFYFVHSFAMPVGDYTLASCRYGESFSAVINVNNFYGTQFHPEKSGEVGQRLLNNFMELLS